MTQMPIAATRYRSPAIALHWLIALLIFGGYGLGLFMHDLPASADKLRYYSWHKWAGVTVFGLALLRAGWRMTHPAPLLVGGARWEHWAAHITHFALYVLMLAIPLSGWLHSSASGYQTVYLGLIPLPDLLGKDKALSELLAETHEWLNYALLLLLSLHAAAALQHHWLRRDDILRRMLPASGVTGFAVVVTMAAALAFGGIGTLLLSEPGKGTAQAEQSEALAASAVSGEIVAEFRQMNVAVEGRFTRFSMSTLQFDADHPDEARADILVDTASFDLGDPEYNGEVRKKEWFDSGAFPQAHFTADRVSKDGDGYKASGPLTIKGRTSPVTVAFKASAEGEQMRYAGHLTVSRAAYAIGDSGWDGVLEDAVIVRFSVVVPKS